MNLTMRRVQAQWSQHIEENRISSKYRPRFLSATLCLLLVIFLGASGRLWATPPIFGVTATLDDSTPKITLTWDVDGWNSNPYYYVSRKALTDTAWGPPVTIHTENVHTYEDTTISVGTQYEYRIQRVDAEDGHGKWNQETYISTGIKVGMVDDRGTIVLVVDDNFTDSLAQELGRLTNDLVGDGWQVIRHDVNVGSTSAASIKSTIVSDYDAAHSNPNNVKAVLLFGHIPVVRSGHYYPDGHDLRSMPTDTYYGDMDGTWTDSHCLKCQNGAEITADNNVASDGIFDHNVIPSAMELQVGRVDMHDMTGTGGFSESETELLRRYLDKDHGFRQKVFSVTGGMAEMEYDSGTGVERQFFGRPASPDQYNSDVGVATPISPDSLPTRNFFGSGGDSPQVANYLWFFKGSGGGYDDGASGLGYTSDYAASAGVKVVFNSFFASHFEEWDKANNFLRAPLAAKGYGLCNVWSDAPGWVFHHMGMGANIGYSTLISQNNHVEGGGFSPYICDQSVSCSLDFGTSYENTYDLYNVPGYGDFGNIPHYMWGGVHMNLMGDPTLRMHILAPPKELKVWKNSNGINLGWTASADSAGGGFVGYHIYAATSQGGPYTRLTSSPVTGTTYLDPTSRSTGDHVFYMVKAVELKTTPSGSYYNTSQGAFPSTLIDVDFGRWPTSSKQGFAAIGKVDGSSGDYWNAYNSRDEYENPRSSGTADNLKLVDGTTTTTTSLSVNNAYGDWGIGSADVMLNGYNYSTGPGNLTVDITSLAPGMYDFYIYSHDCKDKITVNGTDYPASGYATSYGYPPVNPVSWKEGREYVVIRGVEVPYNRTVTLTVYPGADGYNVIAGMQITSANMNLAPVANPQTKIGSGSITLTGFDLDDDALTYTVTTGPAHGSLSGTAPNLTYTPSGGYSGPDFFKFKVNNGTVDSSEAVVNIAYNPSSTLINVDFGRWPATGKVGPAAVGKTETDVWNTYNSRDAYEVPRSSATVYNLVKSDGSSTTTSISVNNAAGDWHIFSPDVMMDNYNYSTSSGDLTVDITSLEAGTYDFYVYAHDCNDIITVNGTTTYPTSGSETCYDYPPELPLAWQQGKQFVVVSGVVISSTSDHAVLTVLAGADGYHVLSGLQIVKR